MKQEKERSFLVLMEQLVMLFVFALAAGICLQAFVKANDISIHTGQLRNAVSLAQTGAELLKSSHGDWDEADRLLKAQGYPSEKEDEQLIVVQDDLTMKISRKGVEIYNEAGEAIYELEVGWQEESYED
ncbi:MAG: hypothetical protein ACOCNB_00470 [Acetivibrio ethanolgignens]